MAGTVVTERVAGIASGYPAEIDATLKVRWVSPVLTNMSERSADFLKYIGGPEQFKFNNTKIEWIDDDVWTRRPTHGGLAAAATTSLTLTGASHRYPIGTVMFHVTSGEYVRVSAHVDANTVTLQRDITGDVTEGAWVNTDEVLVCGTSMDENDDYVFRPTSIFALSYNHPQIFQTGVQATFRRMETAIHGLTGSDLDHQASNTVAEQFVGMEEAALYNARFAGSASVPSMFGGMKFFVTAANGAQVTNLSSAALTRADIENELQDIFYAVGNDKMAKTILCGAWAARKISSFFSGAERLGPQTSGAAGVVVDKLNTVFGTLDVMVHTAIAKNELYLIKKENIKMGHHGSLGRPQLRKLPPSTVGPRVQEVFYADLSMIVTGVQSMARIHTFSTSS